MIGAQPERVRVFAHGVGHLRKVGDPLGLELVDHFEENICQHFRIVRCPVMVEVAQIEIFRQGVQTVTLQLRIDISGHGYRVQVWIFKGKAALLRGVTDKAGVKTGIVRNQQPVFRKCEESA